MEQLTQKLKDGKLQVLEVPVPALQPPPCNGRCTRPG